MQRNSILFTLGRIVSILMIALLLAPLGAPGSAVTVLAQNVVDGFDYPVGDINGQGGWYFWHGFEAFGKVYAGSYHAGEDWYLPRGGTANQPVYAIGAGVVRAISYNSYPGDVVVIEHKLPNGETWYSMYGHVRAQVSVGQSVGRRQRIATIWNQGGNSHLHFEIRNFLYRDEVNGANAACRSHRNYAAGPGYWPVPRCRQDSGRPSDKGWVNPSQFINARRSLIAVGQNSSRQAVFQRAYDATRGYISYGTPTSGAYWYVNGPKRVVRQDFSNGVSLIHDEDADNPRLSVPAYPIYGDFRALWENNLWLGAPTSNPMRNGSGQDEQHFRHGLIKRVNGQLVIERWPTQADCDSRGLWRLEVTNLFHFSNGISGGITWPPSRTSTAGPSLVVCVSPQRSGYAMFYDVGTNSAYFQRENLDQGVWRDHWRARLTGKINSLPNNGFYMVSAACDDGCDIQVRSAAFPWWTQRLTSWRDQPVMHLGRLWVRNGDHVTIDWYERTIAAAVWLKIGSSALSLPPLSAQCEASIKLADGAPVINTLNTTLTISAPGASEMRIGRLDDLSDAVWQPYTETLDWQLEPATSIVTQTVYAQFRNEAEELLCSGAIVADSIVLDMLPPTGAVTLEENTAYTATLRLTVTDQEDGSGVRFVAIHPSIADQPGFDPASMPDEFWGDVESVITIFKPMGFEGNMEEGLQSTPSLDLSYQVWFRDAAGNISEPITVVIPSVEAPPVIPTYSVFLPMLIR